MALARLLNVEVQASTAPPAAGRLRFASLPNPATLADFDVGAAAGIDRKLIDELVTCRYLESATSILLVAPPGRQDAPVGRISKGCSPCWLPHVLQYRR